MLGPVDSPSKEPKILELGIYVFGALMKKLSVMSAIIGAVFSGLLVIAQEQPPPEGQFRIVPTGLVLAFAVGPLTEDDVYLPKYPGEIPYKVRIEMRHEGRGVSFRPLPFHIYPGETIDRHQKLSDGHEFIWHVTLSADASWAEAAFELRHPDQIVLRQLISVHLPPYDG